MSELLEQVFSADPAELLSLIAQVIEDPLSDLQATTLVLIGVVVATLLAIVVAILVIGYRVEDEPERTGAARNRPSVERRSTPEPGRTTRAASTRRPLEAALIGLCAVALAWVVGGLTTGLDSMCMSCHEGANPHAERFADGGDDPHAAVACVRCHEPGSVLASLTSNVPARAAHFIEGIAATDSMSPYGVPAPGPGCASCHDAMGAEIRTNSGRGIRMSHREPLDAGAVCMDCHEIQVVSGVVGTWTVGMTPCLRCHDNEQASAECDSCHTLDVAYAMHANREPAPKRLVPETRCGSCHDQAPCDACHGIRMPHTQEFIDIEHPRAATLDLWENGGRTCMRCHTRTRNSCASCHPDPFPGHPVGVWRRLHGDGGPDAGLGSCDGCHGQRARISGRNFCGVCHEEYDNIR